MQASREPTQASAGRVADLTLAFVVVLVVACLGPAAVLAFYHFPVALGVAVGIPVAAPFAGYLYAAVVPWVDTPQYWLDRGRAGGALDYLFLVLVGAVATAACVAAGVFLGFEWAGVVVSFPVTAVVDALVFAGVRGEYVSSPRASETR